MVGVEIGVDLEDETGHGLFRSFHHPLGGLALVRRRGDLQERFKQLLHAEVVDGAAEKDRRQQAIAVEIGAEGLVDALYQGDLLPQPFAEAFRNPFFQFRILGTLDLDERFGDSGGIGLEQVQLSPVEIVDPFEGLALADRPGERSDLYLQLVFEFVEQLEGVLAFAVHLVDEDDDRRIAHRADLHEALGLGLDALDAVDDEDDAVYGREGAVGVFGKVLVAGCVENVDPSSFVFETHHRGGNRNAPLLLDFHEVAGGRLADLVALDRTGSLDGAAEKQELLGKGGFAGIRVADDGKGFPFCGFLVQGCVHAVLLCFRRAGEVKNRCKAQRYEDRG